MAHDDRSLGPPSTYDSNSSLMCLAMVRGMPSLWDFPIKQDEQKFTILLDGWNLQRVITVFKTWAFGWPNLACHRLLD